MSVRFSGGAAVIPSAADWRLRNQRTRTSTILLSKMTRLAGTARLRGIVLGACAVLVLCNSARSQSSVPLGEPKPVFAAGLYETESRNSSFPDQPVKSRTCLASANYAAFRDETIAQYREAPALKDCHLSDSSARSKQSRSGLS